jgi:mycofactocin precursor
MKDSTMQDSTLAHNSTIEPAEQDVIVEEELLVEEISIDGMCGVY